MDNFKELKDKYLINAALIGGSFVIGLVSANGQVFQNVSSASRSTA